jgi:hypothetical protein
VIRVFCVLRSGGDFNSDDVASLGSQVNRHLSQPLYCLTDTDLKVGGVISIPLHYNWAGWWSKMELWRPDICGDIFYLDLDTVLVKDCRDLLETGSTSFMLDDFYSPKRPASGLMYIAEEDRAEVWDMWIQDPEGYIKTFRGDQDFLAYIPFGKNARRWQRDFLGQVISFKADMRAFKLKLPPPETKVVCFHGHPRPARVHEEWIIRARAL